MDKIILQSVLYSTWVSATGTQVFQHFIILTLAPGTQVSSYKDLYTTDIPVKSEKLMLGAATYLHNCCVFFLSVVGNYTFLAVKTVKKSVIFKQEKILKHMRDL